MRKEKESASALAYHLSVIVARRAHVYVSDNRVKLSEAFASWHIEQWRPIERRYCRRVVVVHDKYDLMTMGPLACSLASNRAKQPRRCSLFVL